MLKRVMRLDVCFVCALHVSTCDRSNGTELLDVLGIKNRVAMFCTRVYLLT